MKLKKSLVLLSVALCSTVFGLFAQDNYLDSIPEAILYEINDDYESFEKYVNSKGSLNVKTKKGMDIVLGTAYFSDDNFEKAHRLLKSKKVNLDKPNKDNMTLFHYICGSGNPFKAVVLTYEKPKPKYNRKIKSIGYTPVEMTQFPEFWYYENQLYPNDFELNISTIRYIIEEETKVPFSYSKPSLSTNGQLRFLIYTIIRTFYPTVTGQELVDQKLVSYYDVNGRIMETITKEDLTTFFQKWFPGSELIEVTESEKIKESLKTYSESESPYIGFVNTGNHPIAPYYWGTIRGIHNKGESIEDDSFIELGNVNQNLNILEYQVKDISLLVLLKINDDLAEKLK